MAAAEPSLLLKLSQDCALRPILPLTTAVCCDDLMLNEATHASVFGASSVRKVHSREGVIKEENAE